MKFHLTSGRHVHAVSMYGVGYGDIRGGGQGIGLYNYRFRGNGENYGEFTYGGGWGHGSGHEDGDGHGRGSVQVDNHIHPRVSASDDVSEAIRTAALQPLLHIG